MAIEDCIFCELLALNPPHAPPNKSTPHVLYSFPSCIAVLDIMPLTSGHTLFIPRKHHDKILQHSESELAELVAAAKKLVPVLFKVLNGNGTEEGEYNLVSNNGEGAGQVVGHVHLHFVPRGEKARSGEWGESRAWKMFAKGRREELDIDAEETKEFVTRVREEMGKLEGVKSKI